MKSKYWFTGDWHLGHKNIVRICKRPFSSLEDMVEAIINNHNSVVKDDDVVFNLGDLGYRCTSSYMVEHIRRFKGKLVIILGNHDKALREALQNGMLDQDIKDGKIEIVGGKAAVFDKSLSLSKMLSFNSQDVYISHYGHRTWPTVFKGAMHLYAHSHNNLPPYYKSFDVGVDTNNFFPYNLDDIMIRMNAITTEFSENPEKLEKNECGDSGQEL